MLVDKMELIEYLDQVCDRVVIDNDVCKKIYDYANDNYELPRSFTSDLVSKRISMSEVSEFILFILFDSIKKSGVITRKEINHFYTDQEIHFYEKSKYEKETIKFPLVFKMIQVENDQWIGKIDIKTLIQLRQAQLINYNINAQRTMQKITKGGKEVYKITLNKKAVREISQSFKSGTFIPNTVTLNMPEETSPEFYYDTETYSLVIESLEHFDITDAYHRLIAAYQVSDLDPEFNYNMELRIVNFTEDKAKQFIYQEDQKTKMRKIDSNSMNMNKAANIVVTRLNDSVRCNYKGLISRNEGIIPFGELAELVHYFYFKNTSKEKERSTVIQATSELTNNFNMLSEYNLDYLEKRMDYQTLLTVMFCFDYYKKHNLDMKDMCEVIEKTANALKAGDSKKFKNKTPRKFLMNEVEKVMKGVM